LENRNDLICFSFSLLIVIGANSAVAQTSNQTGMLFNALEQKGISTAANIIFDGPKKVVLKGPIGQESSLGLAINTAKEIGYTIDSVTVLFERAGRYSEGVYTIFMTK
jgi:trans-2-enoyl-CoA reductase